MADEVNRLIGLEPNAATIKLALHHVSGHVPAGCNCRFPDAAFDVIYVQHVLHQIMMSTAHWAKIRRCLRPDGVLFPSKRLKTIPHLLGTPTLSGWMGDESTRRSPLTS